LNDRAINNAVVPAKAGTHNHRQQLLNAIAVDTYRHNFSLGLWVPAFAGTTAEDVAAVL
jgi:hypothetical protein